MREFGAGWMFGAGLVLAGCVEVGAPGGVHEALEGLPSPALRPDSGPAGAPPAQPVVAPGPVWLDPTARVGSASGGSASAAGSAQEQDALDAVNHARAAAGLSPLAYDAYLGLASVQHAGFLALNWAAYPKVPSASLHDQIPGWPGFTGKSFQDRASYAGFDGAALAEVIAQHPAPPVAITQWLESLYHRLPLLHPDALALGFGLSVDPHDGRGFSVAMLSRRGEPEQGLAVAYPPRGATDVPTSWSGAEVPQPPAPPGGYPSGPMFTLALRGAGAPTLTAHALLEGGTKPVPHVALDPGSDPHLAGQPVVALYAHAPLKPMTTYTVRLKGYVDGQLFTWESWFRTAADEGACDPLAPSCPDARACYLSGGVPTCAWPGTKALGETCAFANDCGAGGACLGGRCVALCRLGAGEPEASADPAACVARCPAGYAPFGGSEVYGACALPECTPFEAGACGDDACLVDTTLRCELAGGRPWGAMCETAADCRAQSACARIGDHPIARCMPLCDARPLAGSGAPGWKDGELYACPDFCPGQALRHPALDALGVCTSPAP